jgi:hypothetical protein
METILWRRLDTPGHDHAVLRAEHDRWRIDGCAVFVQDARPARLDYRVRCDEAWRTLDAMVIGYIGAQAVDLTIEVDVERRRWRMNGEEVPGVEGCIDIDLSWTPCTNLLPIRRLSLPPGGDADVRSAWLRLPDLTLHPLPQRYLRTGERTYRYDSPSHDFKADLQVNAAGFVTDYPEIWQVEAATS